MNVAILPLVLVVLAINLPIAMQPLFATDWIVWWNSLPSIMRWIFCLIFPAYFFIYYLCCKVHKKHFPNEKL